LTDPVDDISGYAQGIIRSDGPIRHVRDLYLKLNDLCKSFTACITRRPCHGRSGADALGVIAGKDGLAMLALAIHALVHTLAPSDPLAVKRS